MRTPVEIICAHQFSRAGNDETNSDHELFPIDAEKIIAALEAEGYVIAVVAVSGQIALS